MKATELFTMSPNGKSEYCCNVVKIGEVKPIENSDFLGQVMIYDKSIVVRKDQVHEGMLMFYASNETQLNKDFLSINNLFEISEFELNANADEVRELVEEKNKKKDELKRFKTNKNKFRKLIAPLINGEEITEDSFNQTINKLLKYIPFNTDSLSLLNTEQRKSFFEVISDSYLPVVDNQIVETEKEIDVVSNLTKKKGGFFNKHGRVRMIRLKGVPSMGFLFTQEELAKYNPKVAEIDMSELLNVDFDTIDGELFVKAYVPYVPPVKEKRSNSSKAQKKIEKFDRMMPGEFHFHYDTNPLGKNIWKIQPTDSVAISVKVHGTSAVYSYIKTRKPRKLYAHKWLWNKFVKITGLFKNHKFIDYDVVYDNVYSSRTVIKNQYINKNVNGGFYKVDVWAKYNGLLQGLLQPGMTVYGEIVGYQENSPTMIQKEYDYGCEIGENCFIPYRITLHNEDGTIDDWNVLKVKEWTEDLIKNNPHLAYDIKPINLLYNGTLVDLYPNIKVDEHWHDNILFQLKEDKHYFGMEELEAMCKHQVPREGICIRIDNDPISECFKLKCDSFFEYERGEIDKGNVDMEMIENEY